MHWPGIEGSMEPKRITSLIEVAPTSAESKHMWTSQQNNNQSLCQRDARMADDAAKP